MTSLTIAIIAAFVLGYFFIAIESVTKINKAAIALLMFVVCWTLFMCDPSQYLTTAVGDKTATIVSDVIEKHLGSTSTTLFFLMGAMTIVELVDQCGGFNFVRDFMHTRSKRSLLWRIAFLTFFLSAILDNLTTSIVMIMILRKLVNQMKDRIIYASLIIIAANSGGAFSPIGDVTTIMLWNKGLISAFGIIKEIFLPSLVSMILPAWILSYSLKGDLTNQAKDSLATPTVEADLSAMQRKTVFILGVGGLIFVPIFKSITHLPPFVGILLVLSILWIVTELFYRHGEQGKVKGGTQKRIAKILTRIDMSTILFFLGILMAVACLEVVGVLTQLGISLNDTFHNHFIVTGIIGVLSSIVDNVPLVAGCMGMYPIQEIGEFAQDGIFWQLLSYCAGVGGSILIIGSAAGVVVMGLEKITFGWYMKRVSWIAFIGYFAGILTYYVQRIVLCI